MLKRRRRRRRSNTPLLSRSLQAGRRPQSASVAATRRNIFAKIKGLIIDMIARTQLTALPEVPALASLVCWKCANVISPRDLPRSQRLWTPRSPCFDGVTCLFFMNRPVHGVCCCFYESKGTLVYPSADVSLNAAPTRAYR